MCIIYVCIITVLEDGEQCLPEDSYGHLDFDDEFIVVDPRDHNYNDNDDDNQDYNYEDDFDYFDDFGFDDDKNINTILYLADASMV